MSTPQQPKIQLLRRPDWRENYRNSLQVRVNVWAFFLQFGTIAQPSPVVVEITNFQGIYLSPQQAKARLNVLQQNVQQYEATSGEIKLDPRNIQAGTSIQ